MEDVQKVMLETRFEMVTVSFECSVRHNRYRENKLDGLLTHVFILL